MPELQFKTKLGLPLVSFIVIGMMVGGGIFVYTGMVYEMTGPLLPLTFALAAIPVFISMMPLAMLGAAQPVTGANYMYPSRLVSLPLAFSAVWVYALASFFGQIPLYVIATGQYLQSLNPDLQVLPVAIGILTFFFLLNLLGIKLAAQFQGVLLVILIAALVVFVKGSFPFFDSDLLKQAIPAEKQNLILGTALLSFTFFGANGIIELGSEIKNPGKTIPRAFFISFPIVVTLYVLVSFALVGTQSADGILSQGDPLVAAAESNLSHSMFVVFVLGGAVLALLTTLNALFLIGTRSLLMIVQDGIFPQWMGKMTKKGVPWVLLCLIWLLSLIGVLSGLSLEDFASYAALGGLVIFLPILIAALKYPKFAPDRYQQSSFKLSKLVLRICVGIGILMVSFFGLAILIDLNSGLKTGVFLLFIGSGFVYYYSRRRYLRKQGKGFTIKKL